MLFNTIHIFGYGEVQVIVEEDDFKKSFQVNPDAKTEEELAANASAQSLKQKVYAIVDLIWDNKPDEDYKGSKTFRAINIFNQFRIDWQSDTKDDKGFSIDGTKCLDAKKIGLLIAELKA